MKYSVSKVPQSMKKILTFSSNNKCVNSNLRGTLYHVLASQCSIQENINVQILQEIMQIIPDGFSDRREMSFENHLI